MSKLAAFRSGWVSLSQDFRGKGRLSGIVFGFYKTRHILLSDNANCTVLCAVVLTQYRRVTDRRTDGQTDVASTALAMRALQCAVKNKLRKIKWITDKRLLIFEAITYELEASNVCQLNSTENYGRMQVSDTS